MKALFSIIIISLFALCAHAQEPVANLKANGDLVITTAITVGGDIDTTIVKGDDVWHITATISAQKITQAEIDAQIRAIEEQIDRIAREEQELLKKKRRLSHGKKSKSKSKRG